MRDLDIRTVRASGGKEWLAWCEPPGRFMRDPYHGRIPLVVSAYGKTAEAAAAKVREIMDA